MPSFTHKIPCLLIWLLSCTLCRAAAPPNDHQANAIPLTTGSWAYGTTSESTLEVGEPLPEMYEPAAGSHSVWYSWTAPSEGWHKIECTASEVAIWKKAAGGVLTAVHAGWTNSYLGRQNPRGLSFIAELGVDYLLSVTMWSANAKAKSHQLRVRPVAAPAVMLTALSVTPQTVDVSNVPQDVTVNSSMQHGPDFSPEQVYLAKVRGILASGIGLQHYSGSAPQRISATATGSTWRQVIRIPVGTPPSVFKAGVNWQESPQVNTVGARPVSDVHFPSPSSNLTVVNTGMVDTLAPTLVRAELEEGIPFYGSANARVTLTLRDVSGTAFVYRSSLVDHVTGISMPMRGGTTTTSQNGDLIWESFAQAPDVLLVS